MCRNIKTLFNFDPPATEEEIRGAATQFVRKLSGFNKPSKVNEVVFNHAVDETTQVAHNLLKTLATDAKPRNRETEAQRAQERARKRLKIRKN